jgi:DeoR/GlpR family transcriptional regulator of sugar metabolism
MERGEVIFLGPGSTTAVFAQFLPNNLDLTVITPSLAHASLLSSRGIEVISTGGVVRDHLAQTGVITQETINRYIATRTVIGVGGVSKKGGLTEFVESVADVSRAMIERCEEVIVLVDPSKSGVTANYCVSPIDAVDEFVTSTDGVEAIQRQVGAGATVLTPNG